MCWVFLRFFYWENFLFKIIKKIFVDGDSFFMVFLDDMVLFCKVDNCSKLKIESFVVYC